MKPRKDPLRWHIAENLHVAGVILAALLVALIAVVPGCAGGALRGLDVDLQVKRSGSSSSNPNPSGQVPSGSAPSSPDPNGQLSK